MSQEVPWWEAATPSAVVTSVAVCVRAGPFAISGKMQVVSGPYGPGLACLLTFGMQREPSLGVEIAVLGETNHPLPRQLPNPPRLCSMLEETSRCWLHMSLHCLFYLVQVGT